MEVNSKVVFTNTTPIGAYRGAGRPEGNYYMERLIDTAAREMGIDKVELRRRNHIAPEQMPYKAPSAMNYDSGEFTTVLDKALAGRRLAGLRQAQGREPRAEQAARPRHRLVSRGHRPAGQGIWRRPLRGRRHHHHAERHARLRPGPRHAVRPGAGRQARHPGAPTSACCRAIPTSSRSAAAPAARSRRWSRARPSSRPATR